MRHVTRLVLTVIGFGSLTATAAGQTAPATGPVAAVGPEVTLIGCMLCNRQCVAEKWNHRPTQGDHTIALYAFGGTREVEAEVDAIMREFWPGDTLDADQAKRLQDEFTRRTKYYLAPGELVSSQHREVEYRTLSVAVTGTILEKDGRKWISVTNIKEGVKIPYPAQMFAPDKPMQVPATEPLVLKVADGLTIKCVKLPPGRFYCGAPFYEVLRFQDEFPHMVTLTKPYYMAETLVTQEMFEAVMGTNPSKRVPSPWTKTGDKGWYERMRHKTPDEGKGFAVENTTWQEVKDFCRKVSERNNGLVVRVPTQAEWEWAARVGTSTPVFHEKYVRQRSYCGDKEGKCEPVKQHPPSAWGLYDMVKSGWEWVSDLKDDNIRADVVDYKGPTRGANHGSGPLRRMQGGVYYGDTHLTLHGAVDEDGNGQEGICMFRLVVEADPPATTSPGAANR